MAEGGFRGTCQYHVLARRRVAMGEHHLKLNRQRSSHPEEPPGRQGAMRLREKSRLRGKPKKGIAEEDNAGEVMMSHGAGVGGSVTFTAKFSGQLQLNGMASPRRVGFEATQQVSPVLKFARDKMGFIQGIQGVSRCPAERLPGPNYELHFAQGARDSQCKTRPLTRERLGPCHIDL